MTTLPDETSAEPVELDEPIAAGVTTGRTWADVVHQYSSNERYLYLIVLLVIGLSLGGSGHLRTAMEQGAAGGLIVLSWLVLYLIQRRP